MQYSTELEKIKKFMFSQLQTGFYKEYPLENEPTLFLSKSHDENPSLSLEDGTRKLTFTHEGVLILDENERNAIIATLYSRLSNRSELAKYFE